MAETKTPEVYSPADELPSPQLALPIERLVRIARQMPRDPIKAQARAIDELESYPEFAYEHYYAIPFTTRDGVQWVEGLSVVAARAWAIIWGNCISQSTIVSSDEDEAKVQGIAVDLETLALSCREWIVKRKAKVHGKWVRLDEGKWQTKIAAETAKCQRNAILEILPLRAKRDYFARAQELAGQCFRADFEKATDWAKGIGLNWEEAFPKAVGGVPISKWTNRHMGVLSGALAALRMREATFEDIFKCPMPTRGRDADQGQDAGPASAPKAPKPRPETVLEGLPPDNPPEPDSTPPDDPREIEPHEEPDEEPHDGPPPGWNGGEFKPDPDLQAAADAAAEDLDRSRKASKDREIRRLENKLKRLRSANTGEAEVPAPKDAQQGDLFGEDEDDGEDLIEP